VAYEYSNYGFAILGRVVANVSGQTYDEHVREHLLVPLGMTSTTLEAGSVPPGRLARGYRLEDGEWREEPPLPHGAFGSMGGMLTDVEDLGRWVAFLLSAWPPRDDPDAGPVSRASLREMQQVARAQLARVTEAEGGGLALTAGGYGYGLRISQTCDFGHVVAHSGGLPGFGSQMRWLPEHGVGIVAMGNLTYTGWGGVIDDALAALAGTGALQPRAPEPSPALLEAKASVSRLISRWDDALADSVAAMNLYLDLSKERRQSGIEALTAVTGACTPDDGFEVENALRGRWRMSCERGALDVQVTLAPTLPPKVQSLSVELADPGRPRARATACPSAGQLPA
jgi:CubicO group peptidase (beta-lactamase class C family)